MNRPIDVELPQADTPGQLIGTMVTLLRALGWELGQRYDEYMRPRNGDRWLEELRRRRQLQGRYGIYNRRLNLSDPSFVLGEPLHHSDSPLRACLPRGRQFYDLLAKVLDIRNGEQHFDRQPSLDGLNGRAGVIGQMATLADLDVAGDCERIRDRVGQLTAHGGIMPGVLPPDEVDELRRRLDAERRRTTELAKSAAATRDLLASQQAEAARDARLVDEYQHELERLRAEAESAQAQQALAQEQVAAAQRAVEEQLTRVRAAAPAEVPDDLAAGDPWPGAPGLRVLRLLPHVRDLYDPTNQSLLSDEVGDVAVRAARRWLEPLPHGGTVHLTDAGYASALIGARWVYLGRLDE